MELLLNTIMLEPNRWAREQGLSRPLIELLDPIRDHGFRALEVWQYHVSQLGPQDTDRLAEGLRRTGLSAPVVGAYPLLHLEGREAGDMDALMSRMIETAAALGATTLKIFPGRVASADADASTRKRSVDRLHELADKLAGRNMQLTMETHGNTLCDTLPSTLQLLQELDDVPNAGLCFQPYSGQDTAAAIAMYDRVQHAVRHVHLQNRSGPDRTCTLLAEGEWIDFRTFLPHVRDSGFAGLLSLEFTAGLFPPQGVEFDPRTVLDNAAQDRQFVHEVWNGASPDSSAETH